MSNRESIIENEVHSWKGIDQRSQPTLVPKGFVTSARGCLFGSGECERIPGKVLSGFIDEPIFMIFPFKEIVLIQTMTDLYTVPLEDLLEFNITV